MDSAPSLLQRKADLLLSIKNKTILKKQGKNIFLSLKVPLLPSQALCLFPYVEHNIDNQVCDGKSLFSQVKPVISSAEQRRKR